MQAAFLTFFVPRAFLIWWSFWLCSGSWYAFLQEIFYLVKFMTFSVFYFYMSFIPCLCILHPFWTSWSTWALFKISTLNYFQDFNPLNTSLNIGIIKYLLNKLNIFHIINSMGIGHWWWLESWACQTSAALLL